MNTHLNSSCYLHICYQKCLFTGHNLYKLSIWINFLYESFSSIPSGSCVLFFVHKKYWQILANIDKNHTCKGSVVGSSYPFGNKVLSSVKTFAATFGLTLMTF